MQSTNFTSTTGALAQMGTLQYKIAWLRTRVQFFDCVFGIRTFNNDFVTASWLYTYLLLTWFFLTICATKIFAFVTTWSIFFTWACTSDQWWVTRTFTLYNVLTLRSQFFNYGFASAAFSSIVAHFCALMIIFAMHLFFTLFGTYFELCLMPDVDAVATQTNDPCFNRLLFSHRTFGNCAQSNLHVWIRPLDYIILMFWYSFTSRMEKFDATLPPAAVDFTFSAL